MEVKGIAREPGHRTKVAVHSHRDGLDPVGACVGMRGIRIQNVVNELQGERIDVIQWDPDPRRYVAHALSPAQVLAVRLLPDSNTAEVAVPNKQLSLAIGRKDKTRGWPPASPVCVSISSHNRSPRSWPKKGWALSHLQPELPKPVVPTPTTVKAQPAAVTPEPATAATADPAPARRELPLQEPEEPVIEEKEEEEEEIEPAAAELEVAAPPLSEAGKIRFARGRYWRAPPWKPSRRSGVRSAT